MKAVLALVFLFHSAAAAGLQEPGICYVLDAVLFIYGTVLTALYCRLKILNRKKEKAAAYEHLQMGSKDIYEEIKGEKPSGGGRKKQEESIYTGLGEHHVDTYESLQRQAPGKK
ncbi:high affinity immunoglobulin epsilon receptor subunit gamma isoform X1 [Leucoraja erinacea]|uniref:high affinity immunoglobulin epsilon receptor subunit gamma isoform X1 n=1 Tax=Leucoraja erinaceus TaxID=7782 RepID=UPI002454A948|nr:high affinity immunoglobulin epsilon receptor subunit gamma isoform X1 [Leucoraja erinacea]